MRFIRVGNEIRSVATEAKRIEAIESTKSEEQNECIKVLKFEQK